MQSDKNDSVSLVFSVVETATGEEVESASTTFRDKFYGFLYTTQYGSDIVDRYIKGSTLTVELAVTDKSLADKIGEEIATESVTHSDNTRFFKFALEYKGVFTRKATISKATTPIEYNKNEPVIQLNVMQSSLPREVYMVPVSYFEKNKEVRELLEGYLDADANVEDTTWAEFHRAVSRKLDLNMDKEFKPFIFKQKEKYAINEMWWIDYE